MKIYDILNNFHDHVQKAYDFRHTVPIKHSIWQSVLGVIAGIIVIVLANVVCIC